jgi:hypothetical protein
VRWQSATGCISGFLIGQLNPILKLISPVAYVKADASKSVNDQTMQLNPGADHTFSPLNPPQNGVVANFSYSSPQAYDTTSFFGGTELVHRIDEAASLTLKCRSSRGQRRHRHDR